MLDRASILTNKYIRRAGENHESVSHPEEADGEKTSLVTGYSGRMAVLLALGWLALLLGRQTLPPLLPTIIEQLSISPVRAGFVLTLMMGLYALLQYPAGRLSDVLSRTTLLVASVVGMILGFALLVTVRTYPQLLLGGALLGTSSAFYFTPSRAFLSELFVERRGQAFGLQTTAGMGGSALAAGVAVTALGVATWQVAFVPSIGLLAIVGVLLHRWSHESYVLSRDGVELNLRETIGRLVQSRQIRRLLTIRVLVSFAFQAIIGFLPAFLIAEKEFSTAFASGSFALVFVVGGITGPLAGRLSDLFPRVRVIFSGLVAALAGLVGMLLSEPTVLVVASIVVMAVGLTSLLPVMGAYFMDLFPDSNVGGDFGAAKTIFSGAGSLGPTYVGYVAAQRSYIVAFAGLAGLLLVAVGLVFTLRTTDGS